MMNARLRVLIVEDSEDDARLLLREIQRGGYEVDSERVQTAASMQAALDHQTWDLVISDHSMPQFDSRAALVLLQKTGQDIPFITVSGTMGEEIAVGMMKAGAHDYLMKGNLSRLVPAIERELAQARVRQERKQADAARARSEQAYQILFENVPIGLYRTSADGQILDANPAMVDMFGYKGREAMLKTNIVDLYVDPATDQKFRDEMEKSDTISGFNAEYHRQDRTTF